MSTIRSVSLTVDVEHDAHLPTVLEVLARAAAGLLLEGVEARIHSFQFDQSEIDD